MNTSDDMEFILKLKDKIEKSTGTTIDLDLDYEERHSITLDLEPTRPKAVFGADILTYPGLARMLSEYTVLSIKEKRLVSQEEFFHFLSRN